MTSHFFHVEGVAAAVAVLGFAGTIIRLTYRTVRKIEDTFTYVNELRSNHIVHIERALKAITKYIGMDYDTLE